MSLAEIVTLIEIAPRFTDPPLSPARPVDYVRLIDWVFYFPHRVRDYVEVYARQSHREAPPPVGGKWDEWQAWLRDNPIQVDFLRMWAVLVALLLSATVLAAGLILTLSSQPFTVPWRAMFIGWCMGVLLAGVIMLSGLSSRNFGDHAVVSLASGMALAFWATAVFGPAVDGVALTLVAATLLSLTVGIGFGVALSLVFALSLSGFNSRRAQLVTSAVIGLLVVLSVLYIARSQLEAPRLLLTSFAAAFAGTWIGAVRLDDYIFALADFRILGDDRKTNWPRIGRVTSLPFRHLPVRVGYWLDLNWALGLRNVASLWNYTAQQEAVRRGVHDSVEALKDDELIAGVARIADDPKTYPWEMVMFGDPLLIALDLMDVRRDPGPATAAERRKLQRRHMRDKAAGRTRRVPNLPTATAAQAVVAGFWYLDHGYYTAARDALRKGPSTPLAQEVQSIAEALSTLTNEENLLGNTKLALPQRPSDAKRKLFWDGLDHLREMARMAQLYRGSQDLNKRHAAAKRAHELLKAAADPAAAAAAEAAAADAAPAAVPAPAPAAPTPATPVDLHQLRELTRLWGEDLDQWLRAPPDPNQPPQKPVPNPFLFAEPLRDKRGFEGRQAELSALKTTWAAGNLQVVFIYGQPLVGKTSLLYVAEQGSQANVQLAWFRLSHSLRDHARNLQLLSAICTAVQEATVFELLSLDERTTTPAIPNLEQAADPYFACETFIRRACRLVQPRNLILVLDEFDELRRAFADATARDRFLTFLWHLHQAIKNFNVLFVSLRAPDIFLERGSNPFAATARLLQVGNLNRKSVDRLLMPTDANFTLQFMPEARAEVFRLSGGHPYFVQLLAYSTVQQYNATVAANRRGEPLLGPEDVINAAGSQEFSQLAQAYFWRMDELAQEIGSDFVAVLETLAAEPDGLAFDRLEGMLTPGMVANAGRLYELLSRMKTYGVIEDRKPDGNWHVVIGLYREWIVKNGIKAVPGRQPSPV